MMKEWFLDFEFIMTLRLDSVEESDALADYYIQLLEARVGQELRLLTLEEIYGPSY